MLQHVPLQHRLGVCTRVCRSFHAAAVAATSSISTTSMNTQAHCDQLSESLQRHGGGVTALTAQGQGPACQPSLASLPCPLLRDLNLYGFSLQRDFVRACTSLTRLLLQLCHLESSMNASSADSNPLIQLSVLRSLQHLYLGTVRAKWSEDNPGDSVLELPGQLLCNLVQLTCLQLTDCQVQSDLALQHLSALSALQHLDLDLCCLEIQSPNAAALTGLQHLQRLTALRLCGVPWAITLHSLPAMTVLTALRVLQLSGHSSVDPAVLKVSSQLQLLGLECRDAWDAEGSAALLAAIGQQPQLTWLEIHPDLSWSPPSAAAFSALTASSCLQQLKLFNCELPACAWQQMFPPTRCLPELCYLEIWAVNRQETQQLSPSDMQAMVSCCPALADFDLGPQLAVSIAARLQQLAGLTSLSVYAPFQDNALSVAQLTGLQRLHLHARMAGERVTVSGLLQLTVLQQLRDVAIIAAAYDCGLDSAGPYPGGVILFNKAPVGAPPDVWLQLKERCEAAQEQAG